MKVIIAEKPSVAKNIAEALKISNRKDGYYEGNEYLITWAFGHLLQLYDAKDYDESMASWKMENFPFIPSEFKYKVKSSSSNREKVDPGAEKQIRVIKQLIARDDVNSVISAMDQDREGELISWVLIQHIQVKKPVYRLLLNEWTPEEVLRGMEKIVPIEEMKSVKDAGVSRQWADWVIGINLTSVATVKYQRGKGQPLNIGRVLLPTLKIVYDRCLDIERFKPEDYFKFTCNFESVSGEVYSGVYNVDGLEEKDKFKEKEKLDELSNLIVRGNAIITEKDVELKKEYPPYLFNLSDLQGHITSKYNGWTSDKVLKVCQGLYEKKYITYPRTASVVLEESLVDKAEKVLNVIKKGLPYEEEISFKKTKRVFDNSKVDSHSAIMPTYIIPNGLSEDEQAVYDAIKNRFIMQFMPVSEYEETKIITNVQNVNLEGYFVSKGKVQKVEGWKKVEKYNNKDSFLPDVNKGDSVNILEGEVTSHKTVPPKLHTEKTLLRVMETCGRKVEDAEVVLDGYSIGTPATRAETISKLKAVGYIKAKGKSLIATELGRKLIETFPVQELFDLEYTGRLEKKLKDIEKNEIEKEDILSEIFDFTRTSVDLIKKDKDKTISVLSGGGEVKVIGQCPECGGDVVEGVNYYVCKNYKKEEINCGLVIGKKLWGANIPTTEAKKIIEGKPTKEFNFKIKKDGVSREWSSGLIYDVVNKKLGFPEREIKELCKCPICGGKVLEGKGYYLCENYKKSCNVILPKKYLGASFSKKDVVTLFGGRVVSGKSFKVEKDGQIRQWTSSVLYDIEARKIVFQKQEKNIVCVCSKCGGNVIEGKGYYLCENYKKSCNVILPKVTNGAAINIEDVKKLLNGEILDEKEFTWGSGKTGKAKLKYTERLEFVFN